MKEYYERYWEKGIEGKVMHEPPDNFRNERWNLLFSHIKRYLTGGCLDVGSGSGFISSEINKVTPVVGTDVSIAAVKGARKRYPGIRFVKASATNLPFENGKFGSLFASEVIEHVLDTEAMFSEFSRVLKKGGYLIITTPELTFIKNVLIALFYWNSYYFPVNPHIRFYSKKNLVEILRKYGFELEHYEHDGEFFHMIPKGMLVVAKKVR